jgi:hypothetical protein
VRSIGRTLSGPGNPPLTLRSSPVTDLERAPSGVKSARDVSGPRSIVLTFVAPKARWPAPIPVRLAIKFVLVGAAAGGLVAAGRPLLAALLAVAAFGTSLLNAATAGDEPPGAPTTHR